MIMSIRPSVAFPNLPTGAALTAGEARQLATKAAALGIEVVAEIDLYIQLRDCFGPFLADY